MKFKYLSGDFIAEYNSIMNSYSEEPEKLSRKYDEKIEQIVDAEKIRLEDNFNNPFEIGSKVMTVSGRIGTVVKCPVELIVKDSLEDCSDESIFNSYFSIRDQREEEIVTCEGNLKKVIVEFDSTEFEKDWGHEKSVLEFWADELEEA